MIDDTTMNFAITDDEGDSATISKRLCEGQESDVVLLEVEGALGVYVTPEELHALADAAEEITGTVRPERLGGPRKEPAEPRVEFGDPEPATQSALLDAARGLIRQAVPRGATGDFVVFLDR